ncbi:MAG: tetratricopeptide repeat protein [Deltaproteobacteria bacterium]|nr:tetratricopeptide repeat protein [Deltaproteobacteria bacterium]
MNEVIDAQLSQDSQGVGNCLGLTVLSNCLLQKVGMQAEALYLERAFGRGPHVLTLLQTKGSLIDIENISPDGFDYKGHLHNPSRSRWGDRELVADIYLSQGNEFFEKRKYSDALRNYDMAIHLNPQYEKAQINKAILIDKMGREKNGPFGVDDGSD